VAAIGSADISRLAEALRMTAQQSGITTQQVLIQSANHILAEMEVRAPVKTGNLRQSLGIRVESDRVTIGPNERQAPYAGYVEFGTKPHVIRPKKSGGVLVFTVGGTKVFTTKVNHPGTQPQPYVRPAFEAWVDSLGTMAAEANVKVIKDNAK
jgi:HK97 gp10 family phage protein